MSPLCEVIATSPRTSPIVNLILVVTTTIVTTTCDHHHVPIIIRKKKEYLDKKAL